MAFGKIAVVSQKKKPAAPQQKEPVVQVRKPVPVYEKGSSVMEILLIAPTREEAQDFLCGVYFNLVQAVSGSQLTAYTREFSTVNNLSERKQNLEEAILKPVGKEFIRRAAEDELPMDQCSITLAQSGNTALSLDLHFTWASPREAAGRQADVVFALLNCAESQEKAADYMQAARNAASGCPVFWILTNFEQKNLFWASDGDNAPKTQLRSSLRELLGVSCGSWEYAAYAQIYGGLEFVRRDGGNAVVQTTQRCREYMPVACHIPVFAAVDALRRFRVSQDENAVPDATLEKLWLLMKVQCDRIRGWYDGNNANGGSGK